MLGSLSSACQFRQVYFIRVKLGTFKVNQVNSLPKGAQLMNNFHLLIAIKAMSFKQNNNVNKISICQIWHNVRGISFGQQCFTVSSESFSSFLTHIRDISKWRVKIDTMETVSDEPFMISVEDYCLLWTENVPNCFDTKSLLHFKTFEMI